MHTFTRVFILTCKPNQFMGKLYAPRKSTFSRITFQGKSPCLRKSPRRIGKKEDADDHGETKSSAIIQLCARKCFPCEQLCWGLSPNVGNMIFLYKLTFPSAVAPLIHVS